MDDDEDLDAPDSSVKYKRPATHAEKGAADLERVTDYFEEKELSVDLSSLKAVSVESEIEKKMQKERQLLRVKVKSEDIEIIRKEMEVSKHVAERKLKENQGDLFKTLVAMTE